MPVSDEGFIWLYSETETTTSLSSFLTTKPGMCDWAGTIFTIPSKDLIHDLKSKFQTRGVIRILVRPAVRVPSIRNIRQLPMDATWHKHSGCVLYPHCIPCFPCQRLNKDKLFLNTDTHEETLCLKSWRSFNKLNIYEIQSCFED